MRSFVSRALLLGACYALVNTVADAQVTAESPTSDGPQTASTFSSQIVSRGYLSDNDREYLRQAMVGAKAGDGDRVQQAMSALTDPLARKIALWAFIDGAGEQLSFYQLDQARRDLAGWPRAPRRQALAEKKIETSGLDPARIVAWFGSDDPQTAEGAMALASALRATSRPDAASELIRRLWREKSFEADVQRSMLARFGDVLTVEDHIKRADMLLYGQQGPAARDMLSLVPEDQRQLGLARIALRNDNPATELIGMLPASVASAPGLAVEKARFWRKHGNEALTPGLARLFPPAPASDEGASRVWTERKLIINVAMKAGDYRNAYEAASDTGMKPGADYAEAEFYAGWIALTKLRDPVTADRHFAEIQRTGVSPITQSRALYWRGRAAEAAGDMIAAQTYYGQGARFLTAFYGQLAAEKAGLGQIALGHDPVPTAADRQRFDGREMVRAARMLADAGLRDQFRLFMLAIDDTLPNAEESALLVDLARGYGDQDTAMRVARTAAQRGFVLPDRAYPMRSVPQAPDAAEPAMVFSITRQESNFDPNARSGPGARGMMQLMPATAQVVARQIGVSYSPSMLTDPDYNMRLGATYLGHVIDRFSGSYVMAAAAYNAGPGRPTEWSGWCGDPRTSSTDPVDFIECIPFSETRNYVMRILETAQVYRSKLNGGSAPLQLSADLKRGGYVYAPSQASISTGQATQ